MKRVLLICKAELMGLYASAGFTAVGLSEVVHGADPWFEMRRGLETRYCRLLQGTALGRSVAAALCSRRSLCCCSDWVSPMCHYPP